MRAAPPKSRASFWLSSCRLITEMRAAHLLGGEHAEQASGAIAVVPYSGATRAADKALDAGFWYG